MSYNFAKELTEWIKINNLSRSDLIARLQQLYYSDFKGLDNITLSRWINGKTTPPLYKQFYIAKCLNVNVLDLYLKVDCHSLKVTEKLQKALHDLVHVLDFSISSLSYNKIPNEVICKIKEQSISEHLNDFLDFHTNIHALEKYFAELYALEDKVKYRSIKLKNENNQVIGHYSGIEDITPLKETSLFEGETKEQLQKSSLVNVGFFKNSKNYFDLLDYLICHYLISVHPKKDTLYLFVGGYQIYSITKLILGHAEYKYYPPNKSKSRMGVYLFKINILKAICNPLLFPSAQKKLLCIKNCHKNDCNLCNLKDYYKKNEDN